MQEQPDNDVSSPVEAKPHSSALAGIKEKLVRVGLGEPTLRIGTIAITIVLLLVAAWALTRFYFYRNGPESGQTAQAAAAQQPTQTSQAGQNTLTSLPNFALPGGDLLISTAGILRRTDLHTVLPAQGHTDGSQVIQYTVVTGDTVFGIADKFGLKPETIMWGNFYILGGVPDLINPGLVLNILPVNGTYHKWSKGEGLNGVAKFYGVKPEDIINWPGNHLTKESVGDFAHPNIAEGTFLVVPNGTRPNDSPATPNIKRSNPSVAQYLGPGYCPNAVVGVSGTGSFVWPTTEHWISGYNFTNIHPGVDFAGAIGNPVFAADTGVAVFAGWSTRGYGNLIVLDHGDGWVTYYGHLSSIMLQCGQGVFKGAQIGAVGSTGNSSGPHLHFEMHSDTYGKVNPMDMLH